MIRRLLGNSNYNLLFNSLEECENVSVFGLNLGEKLALVELSAFLFYVVENIEKVTEVYEKLTELGRTCEILTDNITPFTSEFFDYHKNLEIITKLKDQTIDTLIVTPEILAGKFPYLDSGSISIKKGNDIDITTLIADLVKINYKRVDMVSDKGEFSVKGDIIDIYPISDNPFRVFADFDRIESIKYYNPVTMLTTNEIEEVTISSSKYFEINEQEIENIYRENKLKLDDGYDKLLSPTFDYAKMIFSKTVFKSIFEFVQNAVVAFDGAKVIYNKLSDYVNDYNASIANCKFSYKNLIKKLEIKNLLSFNNHTLVAFQYITEANRLFTPKKVFSIRTLPAMKYTKYNDALALDINNFVKNGYTIVLCIGHTENFNKFATLLDKNHLIYNSANRLGACQKNSINILTKNYPLDILLPEDKLAIISTPSLLGVKKKQTEQKIDFFDGQLPEAGDFVVHSTHGIGKCLGVNSLNISNAVRDYVVVEYKNNDKLYLPVENIDQLSKYLGSDKAPTLNKIGGVEFARTKAKVKSAVKKIAFDLIALYRDRMNLKGVVYSEDDELQNQFENDFGFSETPDQLKAIQDCKNDMQQGRVMDRLVCGDVGFGKTEVALRIAFKTIMGGKQVAFLCPTTILSEQHLSTAKSRFANYGIKVEVLNRLKSPEEVSKIKKDFADGKIEMLCGTHKLLANDIDYKNLGLLILDEEQKFGVADKEKIKNIKKHINVLTLSATPIPRTLNMSLIGVRDISIIETPPKIRVSSNVQVVEYSDFILKSAIDRELNRGGQVLVIYNRVETLPQFSAYVSRLVPSAKISYAHGQMTDVELEREIFDLYSGKTQVLVSTTLIENGVDLPNANTLIVINSDMLGLSQLYQLKGRIGRSDRESYAYFTFDSRKSLSENAYKRLQAIQEFSSMGSGFKIAMRDLEIRGAGSILGLEQSGHIEKIGYNMYAQILSDSIKELNNEKITTRSDVRIESNISAFIPHSFISSTSARMKLYTEIARIDTMEKLVECIKNCENIYGDIPEELNNLIKIGFIKNLSAKLMATRVIIKNKCQIILSSRENLTRELVEISLDNYKDYVSFNFSDNPVIEINIQNSNEILDFLINYLELISKN